MTMLSTVCPHTNLGREARDLRNIWHPIRIGGRWLSAYRKGDIDEYKPKKPRRYGRQHLSFGNGYDLHKIER
jgi:hypothetical protein